MLGTEVDLQRVQNSVPDLEMVLKAWLQEQGGDREQLHLLLPGDPAPGITPPRGRAGAPPRSVRNGALLPSSVPKVRRAGAPDKPRPHPSDPRPGGEHGGPP